MTNFEKIKAMSVEEIAEMLRHLDCEFCPCWGHCSHIYYEEVGMCCRDTISTWLESEAKND